MGICIVIIIIIIIRATQLNYAIQFGTAIQHWLDSGIHR